MLVHGQRAGKRNIKKLSTNFMATRFSPDDESNTKWCYRIMGANNNTSLCGLLSPSAQKR